MSDILDNIGQALELAKADIQANLASKGINASGRSSASLRVERYAGGVRLVYGGDDTAPLPTLEIGRPGGPVPMGFTDILVQWSRDKGLTFESESRRRSFAYLLGQRIKREGTLRHKTPVDVYSSVVMDTADKLKGEVAVTVTAYIHEQLRQQ